MRPTGHRAGRSRALKLDPAFLRARGPLDCNHLSLHLNKLSRRLLVAADEESRRPKDDDGCRSGETVIGTLLVLCARQRCRPGRYSQSLQRQLRTVICLIRHWRDVRGRDIRSP